MVDQSSGGIDDMSGDRKIWIFEDGLMFRTRCTSTADSTDAVVLRWFVTVSDASGAPQRHVIKFTKTSLMSGFIKVKMELTRGCK